MFCPPINILEYNFKRKEDMIENDLQQKDAALELIQSGQFPWKSLLGTGILIMILGIIAISLPVMATMAIEIILAAVLITAGIAHIYHAFKLSRFDGREMRFLAGILYLGIGLLFAFYPFTGALTLTIVLALLFMVGGTFRIVQAILMKPHHSWGWLLFNGILSILLGLIIWIGLTETANWVIGLLVGIDLLVSGIVMIAIALSTKKLETFNL